MTYNAHGADVCGWARFNQRDAYFTANWVEPKRVCEDLFCILVQKRS